jgi:hypothetical protein
LNLEERVKAHITDLQRHIKANVLADMGGVRHMNLQDSLFVYAAL